MAASITAFIYGLLAAIPPVILSAAGWFLIVAGAVYFFAGLMQDDHRKGKRNCWMGFLYAFAGAILALFPEYPVLAGIGWFLGSFIWN